MVKTFIILLLISFLGTEIYSHESGKAPSTRPNIIIISSGRLAFGDIRCFGGLIDTPNLDLLGMGGLRITQFKGQGAFWYSNCEMLSGQYAKQLSGTDKKSENLLKAMEKKAFIGLPDLLGRFGYATMNGAQFEPFPHLPKESWASGAVELTDDAIKGSKLKQFESLLNRIPQERPFFLFWTPNIIPFSLNPIASVQHHYKARFDAGPIELSEEIYRNQLEIGIVRANVPWKNQVEILCKQQPEWRDYRCGFPVPNGIKKGKAVETRLASSEAEMMEAYATTVAQFDREVGALIATLKPSGRFENTLILVCGACGADGSHAFLGDSLNRTGKTYGMAWAYCSATPFYGSRLKPTAGGNTTPLIVHYPNGMADGIKGSIRHVFCTTLDLMPTVIDACGISYPEKFSPDIPAAPLPGESFLGLLRGESFERKGVYCSTIGADKGVLILNREWTLFKKNQGCELYHRDTDPYETNNVAEKNPEVILSLQKTFDLWLNTELPTR